MVGACRGKVPECSAADDVTGELPHERVSGWVYAAVGVDVDVVAKWNVSLTGNGEGSV